MNGQAERGVQWPRQRSLRAVFAGCALAPGLAQACISGFESASVPMTLFLADLVRVLVLILVVGLMLGLVQGLVDLVARQWAWQRWLHLSRLTRWSHIAAGLATLSLAAFTQFALPSPDAIVSFEADMLCPVVWLFQLQGLMPLALPLWALGLWRDRWRQRPAWSFSWALTCALVLGLLPRIHWHPVT